MTLEEFRETLAASAPPDGLGGALEALWRDANDDWAGAHRAAQAVSDASGAWVHAYLHRKEGDLSNAGYWYRRAGRDMPDDALAAEWACIARTLLAPAPEGDDR